MQYTTSRIYYSFIARKSTFLGFSSEESACNAGDEGSIPGWKTSPEEGNGNPLQYSCLGNPMDRGAWWATVHGVVKSLKLLSPHAQANKYF